MMKNRLFFTGMICLSILFVQCVTRKEGQVQKLGEFIVQLKGEATIESLVKDYEEYEMKNKKVISKTIKMYLVSYNEILINQDKMRKKLEENEKVAKVEMNTKVSNRE